MDLIKLASFFAANWLKQFGPIGKALAVGVIALAPIVGTIIANILTKALVNGIANIIKTGLLGLGTLLKATLMSFAGKGGLVSAAIQGRAGASAVTGITRGNLAVGSFLAAGAVGALAVDSFKKGGKRENTAGTFLGIGALGLLTTTLAATFGVALSPIILPVTAVATGIGLIVKFFPQIMDFFRFIGEKLGIIAEKDKDGNRVGGSRTLADDISGVGAAGSITRLKNGKNLSKNELAAWDLANSREAIWSDSGLLMNAGQLTQENASQRTADYIKSSEENKNKFFSNYELLPFDEKRVRRGDYQTDWITKIDGVEYAVAPRGTKKKFDEADALRKKNEETGINTITSIYGLAGNYENKRASTHKGPEHFRPVAPAMDVVITDNGRTVGFTEKDASYLTADTTYRGGEVIIHGDKKGGILGRHGHLQKYMTTEDYENWDAYQREKAAAKKTSIGVEDKEKEEKEKKLKEQEEKDRQNATVNSTQDAAKQMSDSIDDKLRKVMPGVMNWRDQVRSNIEESKIDYTGNENANSRVLGKTVAFSQFQSSQIA